MNQIEIMLKEYETLRQEILISMSNRNTILSFGLGTIGVIFTASIATDKIAPLSHVSTLILTIAVPLICIFVVMIWLGEYGRMQRAGKFLGEPDGGLESRINDKAKERLLTWETDLRRQSDHMRFPYIFTILLLIAIGFIAQYIGYFEGQSSIHWVWPLGIAIAEIATSIYAIRRILILWD